MTCEEAIRSIEAMLDREIDDDERMQLEAHLAGCESCRRETDERRAFSDRLGRDLNDAFPLPPPAAPRVVFRSRKLPWVRWAAVVIVGIGVGYVGASTGIFAPASAEAREVAKLSATKEALEVSNEELAARLQQDASLLDKVVSRTPDGTVKDVGVLAYWHAAAALAGDEAIDLPQEPEQRVQYVCRQLSQKDWSKRGRAVYALRQLPSTDAPLVENQIINLEGPERTYAELWVRAAQAATEPAISMVVEREGRTLRVTQHRDARVCVEASGAPQPRVYEAPNLMEFRRQHPAVARELQMKGVDGRFCVAGVQQSAPAVETRPIAYVPAVVGSDPSGRPARYMEALAVQAVMADCARAGRSLDEAEKRGLYVLSLVHKVSEAPRAAVQADPARVKRHLATVRGQDRARLTLTREQLNDEILRLERRLQDMQQRLESVRTALVALEYASSTR